MSDAMRERFEAVENKVAEIKRLKADAHFISNNGIIGVGLISLADEHIAEHGYDDVFDKQTYQSFYVDAARQRIAE